MKTNHQTGTFNANILLLSVMIMLSFLTLSCDRDWDNPWDEHNKMHGDDWTAQDIRVELQSNDRIRLSWQNSVLNVEGYVIHKSSANGPFQKNYFVIRDTSNCITDSCLDLANTEYTYSIRAFAGNDTSSAINYKVDCMPAFIDTRDGRQYKAVQIGNQCWMAENLNIGTMISSANYPLHNSVTEKYCYDDDKANCELYGGLYDWLEAMNYNIYADSTRGICPTGWHIPSDEEWCELAVRLESDAGCDEAAPDDTWSGSIIGRLLKSVSGWDSSGNGANDFGFNALPAGYLLFQNGYIPGKSVKLGKEAHFFTSTYWGYNPYIWTRRLRYTDQKIERSHFHSYVEYRCSIRCIKDPRKF